MLTEITPYTALKRIVAFALDELQKSSADEDRYWGLAFRALVNMTYSVAGEPITVKLLVGANKTVAFPSNCLSWSKVGIVNEKGEVVSLKINNALTTYRDVNPNRFDYLNADVNNSIDTRAVWQNYYYGGGYYQLFGVGGGVVNYGECRVDEKNRVIVLPFDFKYDSILFEFINCPEKDDDYAIPTCLQEAVISFIKWKDKAGTREDFYAAVIEGRRSLPKKKVILQSLHDVIRVASGQTLKS